MKKSHIGADISASSTRRRRREDEGAATGDEWTSIAVRRGRVVGFASDSRRMGVGCVHLTSHDSIASGSASRARHGRDRPTDRTRSDATERARSRRERA